MADVPAVAGVPALLTGFASVAAGGNIGLMVADAIGLAFGSGAQWGIFRNGVPVVTADNVVSFEFKRDWVESDYPLERGAFESYNKVQIPFLPRVRFSAGGSSSAREALLGSIAAIAGDFNIYDVVTPDAIYTSVNITHYDYHRAANSGVGLIVVDVWLQEVRVAVSQTSSSSSSSGSGSPSGDNTAAPSGASQTNGGTVQPVQETGSGAQGSNVG